MGEPGETSLYYAYGSNLTTARMVARIASARPICAARAQHFRLSLGKAGRDGSGKATLVAATGAFVWGIVYAIDPGAWPQLDRFEPGYERVRIPLATERGRPLAATTYIAPETAPDPTALRWYKRLIVGGAQEHGLPADYISRLERLPERLN